MKEQAIDIIEKGRVIFLATVDEDGMPRSTIVLSRTNDKGELVWHSSPHTTHSQNITRDGRVGISTYYEDVEINEFRAVYISTTAHDSGSSDTNDQNAAHVYTASLGEYDEVQSKPNRLYFRESQI